MTPSPAGCTGDCPWGMEEQGRGLWERPAVLPEPAGTRRLFHLRSLSVCVRWCLKATGKGAFSDLPQKSDHALPSPASTSLRGAGPAGDLLRMALVLRVSCLLVLLAAEGAGSGRPVFTGDR